MSSFLFNLAHDEFAEGRVSHLPTVTISHGLLLFARLFGLIALPIALLLTFLIGLMGFTVWSVLLLELGAAFLISAAIVIWRYLRVRYLVQHGQLVPGEIVDYDTRPALSLSNQTTTVLVYQFRTPDERLVRSSMPLADRLSDGRPYPDTGTRLTVLYRTPDHHIVL